MSTENHLPYANLNPNVILNAIDSAGFRTSGSLVALNSYENRVYQVGIEDSAPVIAKFYRPARWSNEAIQEEHDFAKELTDLEIPVIAPIESNQQTLHHYNEFRFAVFPRRGGHALELDSFEQLEWMGRFLGRLHAVSACKPFKHRPTLNVQTHGYYAYHYLIEHQFIPSEIKSDYCQIIEALLKEIEKRFASIEPITQIRLHGDCHAGNVLWNQEGLNIVDLDDCVMGPAVQDIWMLLSGKTEQMAGEIECILEGYNEFHDFNRKELCLIEPLRALRMLQYSAWLANRWEDPAFPKSFPWFNTMSYWREHLRDLNEQLQLMME